MHELSSRLLLCIYYNEPSRSNWFNIELSFELKFFSSQIEFNRVFNTLTLKKILIYFNIKRRLVFSIDVREYTSYIFADNLKYIFIMYDKLSHFIVKL